MKLADKVALVTGAGRNIGEAVAKLFASEGASIAVVDLDLERAQAVASEIVADGGNAKAFACDVGKEDAIVACVRDVSAAFGRIDILINNAAITDRGSMFDIST